VEDRRKEKFQDYGRKREASVRGLGQYKGRGSMNWSPNVQRVLRLMFKWGKKAWGGEGKKKKEKGEDRCFKGNNRKIQLMYR